MGFSKKTGKGRLDKYYFLAKDQGYRARSAFKLIQLHRKYKLLEQARVVVDLCAAPGGWLQVAAKYMPTSNIIIGVDLVPIKPIPGVKTIVADITTEKCRSELKKELKTWKADVVLHDGAPNVGKAWLHDAYSQTELVLHSLKLATELLIKGGAFVSKVFRSKDYNALMWVFNQLFEKVEATKPASSRNVSAEIFVVCRGFKAPSHIDPRFLDPKHVFEDITALQTHTKKIDLLHPEKNSRHRDGYEDGATILYNSISADDFVRSAEPNIILSTYNAICFPPETTSTVLELAEKSSEVKVLCADLKVLGRREFKLISKWRKQVRAALGLDTVLAEEKEVQQEEIALDPLAELEGLSKRQARQEKREKRKAIERKAKLRMRMQLGMDNADDLADEVTENQGLFTLKSSSAPFDGGFVAGNDEDTSSVDVTDASYESGSDALSDDSEELRWESELEGEYNQKNSAKGLKATAIQNQTFNEVHDTEVSVNESEQEDVIDGARLNTHLLSKDEVNAEQAAKMALWYSNPIFEGLEADQEVIESSKKKLKRERKRKAAETVDENEENQKRAGRNEKAAPGEIIFVKAESLSADEIEEGAKDALLTPSGMTLASKLAKDRKRARKDLLDNSFNRYAFKNDTQLPRWFADDEHQHNRPQKPITKEGVALLKAKLCELDARPIRKELEAKGRNKRRALKKLEQLKKKAAIIADAEDLGERQKGEQIQRLLTKANKPQKKEVKLVVATGRNRGVKGRPKGVKGHYKMVDSRMKKELRAQRRTQERKKGKGGRGRSRH